MSDGKILITDGGSTLGQAVIRLALESGHRVKALLDPDSLEARPALEGQLESLGAEVAIEDLGRRFALEYLLADCKGVIHLHHYYHFDPSERDAIYRINLENSGHLLTAAREAGIEKFLFRGTVFAQGTSENGHPADESTPWNLGEARLEIIHASRLAELEALRQGTLGLPLIVATPSFLIGPGAEHALGAFLSQLFHGKTLLIPRVPLSVIDVQDAARGLYLAYEKGVPQERYLLSGPNTTLLEMAQSAQKFGNQGRILPLPAKSTAQLARLIGKYGHPNHRLGELADRDWRYRDHKAREHLGHHSRPLDQSLKTWWESLSD